MFRVLFVLFLVLLAPQAHAKFTTFKYNATLEVLTDPNLRSDMNWINYRMQNDNGPKFTKEFSEKYAEMHPLVHPIDVGRATDKRRDEFFKVCGEDLAKIAKPTRDREIMFVIDSFEDAELERIKDFFKAYPKIDKAFLSYDNFRNFTYEVHALYTKDHHTRWDIAADISALILQNKPIYIEFKDDKAENMFYNNIVNYLTNNFDVKKLKAIKEFLGAPLGQRYMGIMYRLFNARYHSMEEIYKKNYVVFVEPEQEKKSDDKPE